MKNSKIIFYTILIVSILTVSCSKENTKITGSGDIITKSLTLESFDKISVEGIDDVNIKYGIEQKVEVTGHSNIINLIKTKIKDKTWNIELENGTYSDYELLYNITLPTIKEIKNTGTGDINILDSISISNLNILINGTGDIHGFLLKTNSCDINITGSGSCEINALENLDVNIQGSGNVYYKGNPNIKENISGSGRIFDLN